MRLDTGTEEDSIRQLDTAAQSQSLDWELDTVNSSPTSTHWELDTVNSSLDTVNSSPTSTHWELDTVNSSPTSTHWTFPIQTNVHAARVLKPPTTSCSPAPPSTLWDARHGPVWWMPTGSFGDRLRHCSRLRTSPYSQDWRSSKAGNAEEEEEIKMQSLGCFWAVQCQLQGVQRVCSGLL